MWPFVMQGVRVKPRIIEVALISVKLSQKDNRNLAHSHACRIGRGEGKVVTHRGKSKLVVDVRFLHQSVSIEIDDFMVEPIG